MTFQWREVCIPAAAGGEPTENVTDSCINNSREQTARYPQAGSEVTEALDYLKSSTNISVPPLQADRWKRDNLYSRWVLVAPSPEQELASSPAACQGWPGLGPQVIHDRQYTTVFFPPFFPTFTVWPSRGEALGVTSVPAGLTQLRFSKNMHFLYCWPLRRLILEYKQPSHKTTMITVPWAIYFYCANHSWLF